MTSAGEQILRLAAFADATALLGRECAVSAWHRVTQDDINRFADLTGDHHWLHVDVEKSRHGEYGATLVHGFLTASLISRFYYGAVFLAAEKSLNVGFDRLRFVSPVTVGSRLRGRFTLASVLHRDDELRLDWDVLVECEGQAKPALVARWLTRHYGEADPNRVAGV
jgi:acyl dehydratase